jgi:hypothetical protein
VNGSYSPFIHLAHAISGLRYSLETKFAMLTCYFDESGGEDRGFMIVCGYVASVEQWDNFEVDWKLFLIKYGVPYFHTKEFAQCKGPFAKWEEDKYKSVRAAFCDHAGAIIHNRAERAFICNIGTAAFDATDKQYELRELFNSPYAMAGRMCASAAREWSTQRLDPPEMEYVFEDGGPDKGGLNRAMTELRPRFSDPIVRPSRDMKDGRKGVIQLQAADFLAYELGKWQADLTKAPTRPPRKSLRATLRVYSKDVAMMNVPRLRALCEEIHIARRRQGG